MKHSTPVNRQKKKDNKIKIILEKFNDTKQCVKSLEDEDLITIVSRLKLFVKFRVSIFTRLFASYLPK